MIPNLAGLSLLAPISAPGKRQRVDEEEQDNNQDELKKFETLETVVINYVKPLVNYLGGGGALPPLPVKDVVQKRMKCEGNDKELVVPTATLMPSNVYGRKTLLYHSFINPCQPKHKGQVGDLGRVKWFAFEPQMSYNFLLEAMADKKNVAVAKWAAAKMNCTLPVPETMMDVYEVVEPINNLMLFSDQRDDIWYLMGGQQALFTKYEPLCFSKVTTEMMKSSGADPTRDPRSPWPELSFAKRLHEIPFQDGTNSSGWIRLNSALPISPSSFDPNDTGDNVTVIEVGYELMLSVEDHSKYLKHVKRVKTKASFQDPMYNVEYNSA